MKRVAWLALLALGTVLCAVPLRAQDESGEGSGCGLMYIFRNGGAHAWASHEVPEEEPADTKDVHSECGYCFDNGEPGDPFGCHPACPENFAGAPEKGAVYQVALAAASAWDTYAPLDAARTLPEYIGYHAGRGAIQVLGCDGQVVASIPIRDPSVALAAKHQLQSTSALHLISIRALIRG